MLKKLFVSLFCFCLSFQFAFAGQAESLNEAYEDFKFSVTVDWDQKDQAVAAKHVEAFLAEVVAQKVTPQKLTSFLASKIQDERERAVFKDVVGKLNGDKLTMEEARALVAASLKKTSQTGASWSPVVESILGVTLLLTVMVVWYGSWYLSGCASDGFFSVSCD